MKYRYLTHGVRLLTFTALTTFTVLFSTSAQARDLTVVAFGGALQEAFRTAYFEPYSKAKGIKIVEDSYGGGIAKQKAMVESSNVTWDLVEMDENEMAAACEQGLLEHIDKTQFSNAKDVDPAAFTKCGVGAFVWSKVLTYDGTKFKKDGPKSWADFWNTKKWPGKRGLRKQPRMTFEIALLADGVKPQDVYKVMATKSGQDRVFAKLDELKDSIVWWETGAQPLEWLNSGVVSMTSAYGGRVAVAAKEGKKFKMTWNNQLYSIDYWTVIKGSPNKAQALDLLNFALAPENQASFAKAIPYGILNKRALPLISKSTQEWLPTTPEHLEGAVLLDTAFWLDHETELLQRFTKWVGK
jgi:putative spermidine/putrescine transport system substrate-binding protein